MEKGENPEDLNARSHSSTFGPTEFSQVNAVY